jgi:hypothetical protein
LYFSWLGYPKAATCHRDTGPTAKWRCYLAAPFPHRRSERVRRSRNGGTAKKWFTGVKLDDQLFVDDRRDLLAGGDAFDFTLEIVLVEHEPVGHGRDLRGGEAARAELARDGVVAHFDHVADLGVVAGDADPAAVDVDVAVVDHLARGAAGIGQAEAENDVVEAGFEELEQRLAGDAALAQASRNSGGTGARAGRT